MTASAAWVELTHDGVRLACREFGGSGPPALLLHGVAGQAGDWAETASWLTTRCRVLALDARGHGLSEREPNDVSCAAHLADASTLIEQLEQRPVILVGHSFGGVTALLLAARRPELVRALILADASPAGDPETAKLVASRVGDTLRRWPVPFATQAAGLDFFLEQFATSLAAEAAADGLEQRDDGWWPRFDVDVMVRTVTEAISKERWEEWQQISCPTLVVRAGAGNIKPEVAQEMLSRLPGTRLVDITGASNVVHLDRPDEWRAIVTGFLDSLPLRQSPLHSGID